MGIFRPRLHWIVYGLCGYAVSLGVQYWLMPWDGPYSPNQHFFPKYANGFYRLANGTPMFVSRGLARESSPIPRFFNHPEVVFIDLTKGKSSPGPMSRVSRSGFGFGRKGRRSDGPW